MYSYPKSFNPKSTTCRAAVKTLVALMSQAKAFQEFQPRAGRRPLSAVSRLLACFRVSGIIFRYRGGWCKFMCRLKRKEGKGRRVKEEETYHTTWSDQSLDRRDSSQEREKARREGPKE